MDFKIYSLSPILQAFIFGIFTWFLTLIGASVVILSKNPNKRFSNYMFGFAGGVMLSASFFSLLLPSIEYSKNLSLPLWFPVSLGFLLGCFFLFILDKITPHLHLNFKIYEKEGVKKDLPVYFLLIFSITLHNIPEGLSVGVSFGSLKYNRNFEHYLNSTSLALGIGVQNLPEGIAV
ncbi:MAG: ZIP family metal transporter, partial [bacterium]|nr:ZIP family metal transporter [bacterium]MDW8164703.1 ZIP family metal transporter [Candidatus Omnitrophota bacterium]